MAFWGVEVKPGKPHSHQFYNTQRRRLHISQATLGVGTSTTKSLVQCNVGDKAPVLLCCLIPEKSESCHLALEFEEEDDDVVFSVLGPRSVHLTGFYLDKSSTNVNNGDDTDSYGEDIGQTESDPCGDCDDDDDEDEFGKDFINDDDEDEFGNDFINDDGIELVPDSLRPKSQVVIEEILDDVKPTKVNGNRKRFKKKHQVSDSDGDVEKDISKNDTRIITFESDDEEGFPLSSVMKTNHQESDSDGNDQKQNIDKGGESSFDLENENEEQISLSSVLTTKDGNIQEKSEPKEFMGNKKNEAEDVGDQVPVSERKIEDLEGFEIERRIEQPTKDPLNVEPPKNKKRKRSKDGRTGGVRDDIIVDVDKEKAELVEAKNKEKAELVEAKIGMIDVHRKENIQVEEPVYNDFNQELSVKDNVTDDISNDKFDVHENDSTLLPLEIAHNNQEKQKKKKKKHAKEGQTGGAAEDSLIFVHKEVQSEILEVATDNVTMERIRVTEEKIDQQSNDMCVVLQNDSSLLPLEIAHDNKEKQKKKCVKEGQTGGVGEDNSIFVHKDVQSEISEKKTDDVTMEECIAEEIDQQSNDMIVTIDSNNVIVEEITGKEKNGCDLNAEDAKNSYVAEIES